MRPPTDLVPTALKVETLKREFPLLLRSSGERPLVFLDNASTTQKPQRVIDAETEFYQTRNANVHRGVYTLSEQATEAYEGARRVVAEFIGAGSAEQVIFVRNATEGINLIAGGWGASRVNSGDTILLTAMEHHSNLVPWQRLARERQASLSFVELDSEGRLDLSDLRRKLARRPALFAFTAVSNVLGTVNPVREIVALAHAAGVAVVVDAAQAIGRLPVDVQAWDADFVVFSGHKMYGPAGVGVACGKRELLDNMEPFLTGGDMVKTVTRDSATWNDVPWKFEAGTPNIAGAVALGEAARFLYEVGVENIWAHEQVLVAYALPKLLEIQGLKMIGPGGRRTANVVRGTGYRGQGTGNGSARYLLHATNLERAAIFSFTLPGVHSHDLASFLNERGIAVRGGHHCAQPLLQSLGMTECARASAALYTNTDDIDRLVDGLREARKELV